MGWLERPPEVHRCQKPYLPYRLVELRVQAVKPGDHVRIGDRWQCDECKTIWVIKDCQKDGPYWEKARQTPPNPGGGSR